MDLNHKGRPDAHLDAALIGSVTEFKRSTTKERQAEGIARAKARDVYKGRTKVLTDAQVVQARQRAADGVSKAEFARRLGIGRITLYKYFRGEAGES
ncbi:transposase [Corynebacterium sp. NML130628]|nr:transposase [Corynebacterium sp. NML130628]